jgi:hypothetical protein
VSRPCGADQAIAAKEEQTKETIGAIVQGGKWSFKVIPSQSAAPLCDFGVEIELSEDERVLPSATFAQHAQEKDHAACLLPRDTHRSCPLS